MTPDRRRPCLFVALSRHQNSSHDPASTTSAGRGRPCRADAAAEYCAKVLDETLLAQRTAGADHDQSWRCRERHVQTGDNGLLSSVRKSFIFFARLGHAGAAASPRCRWAGGPGPSAPTGAPDRHRNHSSSKAELVEDISAKLLHSLRGSSDARNSIERASPYPVEIPFHDFRGHASRNLLDATFGPVPAS